MMKKGFSGASILFFALMSVATAHGAVAPAAEVDHVNNAQLKQMAREAHTPEQYQALANSYERQQKYYLKQAADEKQEWVRRSQITTSLYAKSPSPADTARNLYEYYVEKASEAGALSAKYSQMAEPMASATEHQM